MTELELKKILPNASEDEIKHILETMNGHMKPCDENVIADELNYMHEGWEGPYNK